MTRRRNLALGAAVLLLAAVVAGVLVGFGGNGTKRSASAAEKTRVVRTWTAFFAGSTPASKKVELLQDGRRFAALIETQAASPLARQTKATVTKVTLDGSTHATVVYTITLAGQPALKNQIGSAVRVGGTWKVSVRSFCTLLSLQGTEPPACMGA